MVPPFDGFPGEGHVLGSVHHWVSNLSFGSGAQGPLRFTGSPVHVSASFEARALGLVSASYPATTARRSHSRLCWFPVGFRPPAFASCTPCSRQRIPLSSQSAYRPATRAARTLSGFPCSARMRCDRVGCLLYPGAAVSSRPAQPLLSGTLDNDDPVAVRHRRCRRS